MLGILHRQPINSETNIRLYQNILDNQELSLDSLNLDAGKKFPYEKLDFKLNDEMKNKISLAGQHLDELNVDTDDEVFIFEDFGKSFIKTCNCSPDAFMQMSLQLAYFRWVCTYLMEK